MAHGARENEIKLAVANASVGRRLLRAAGFRVSRRKVFERNTVFDTPDRSISRSGRLLRIRQAGKRVTLTYKGPPDRSRHKSREELETEVSDAQAMGAILERLGFKPVFRYEKYRTEYKQRGSGIATLDVTPIGVFLELEGPPRWVDTIAHRMGFREADYITTSYARLYFDWCKQRGVKPSNLVFSAPGSKK
jgi:adenylate cyclase class 2